MGSGVEHIDLEDVVRATQAGRRLHERRPLVDDVHDVLVDMLMNHAIERGGRLNIDALARVARRLAHTDPRGAGPDGGRGPGHQGAAPRLHGGSPDHPDRPASPDRLPAAHRARRGRARRRPMPRRRSEPARVRPQRRSGPQRRHGQPPRHDLRRDLPRHDRASWRQPVAARITSTAARPHAHVPPVPPRGAGGRHQARARRDREGDRQPRPRRRRRCHARAPHHGDPPHRRGLRLGQTSDRQWPLTPPRRGGGQGDTEHHAQYPPVQPTRL